MRRAINLCVLSSIMFMILLVPVPYIAAYGTALYAVLYALTFVLCGATALLIARRSGMQVMRLPVKIERHGVLLSLPFAVPSVALIMLAAELTSYLLSLVGAASAELPQGNAAYLALAYVIIPAVGEELLFRYIPISLIAPYSRRGAVIVSALLFSAVHADLFQLPYAFFAGLIFAFVDISANSVLPSVLVHTVNNTLSVLLALSAGGTFLRIMLAVFAVLGAVSLLVIILRFGTYREEIKKINSHGGRAFTPELAAFLCMAVLIACASAF